MHSFFWLHLTVNAPNFRLIPLDRNIYITDLTASAILVNSQLQNDDVDIDQILIYDEGCILRTWSNKRMN